MGWRQGIGLAASGNIHPGKHGLFEPVHGSAPDIAGKGLANPLASIMTVGLMLENLGHADCNAAILTAVQGALAAGEVTQELGGTLSTTAATDAVLRRL